jgi:hypothetical protein
MASGGDYELGYEREHDQHRKAATTNVDGTTNQHQQHGMEAGETGEFNEMQTFGNENHPLKEHLHDGVW